MCTNRFLSDDDAVEQLVLPTPHEFLCGFYGYKDLRISRPFNGDNEF